MDELEAEGIWWLPATPESTAAGTLRFAPYGRAELLVVGSWDPTEPLVRLPADPAALSPEVLAELEAAMAAEAEAHDADGEEWPSAYADFPARHDVIHGVIHGHLVTLLDARESSRDSVSMPGLARSRHSAGTVLRGAHVGAQSDTQYATLSFGLEHLDAWCGTALLTQGDEPDPETPLGPHATSKCVLADGAELTLGYRGGNSYGMHEHRHWREPELHVVPAEPMPLHDLVDSYLGPFQDLITTCVGTPSAATRLSVTTDDATWDGHRQRIDVGIAHLRPAPTGQQAHPHQNTLGLADIDFAVFLPAWFTTREARKVAAQFAYAQRYGTGSHAEEMLILAAAGAEALHESRWPEARVRFDLRPAAMEAILNEFPPDEHQLLRLRLEHLNDPSLRSRLTCLADEAGELFDEIAGDRTAWVTRVVRARNDVAHGASTRPTVPELVTMAEAVGHLLELNLLLEAGAARDTLARRLPTSPRHRLVAAHRRQYLLDGS